MKQHLLFELHDNGYVSNRCYAGTQAKALYKVLVAPHSIRRKRIMSYIGICRILVVCRHAKGRAHMAAALDPLQVPPRPWHSIGLDFLTHLLLVHAWKCFGGYRPLHANGSLLPLYIGDDMRGKCGSLFTRCIPLTWHSACVG
jgi:hypothetical protein